MHISKTIEVSWTQEEVRKIEEFRRFLQDASTKVEDVLPSLYEQLDKIDTALFDVLNKCFDEDVDL